MVKSRDSQKKSVANNSSGIGDHADRERYIKRAIIWYIAFKNLLAKKLRSALTIGGVVIGIGAIVFLVSLGLGLQRVVTEQVVDSKSVRTIDVTSPKPKTVRLDSEALKKFHEINHVESLAVNYSAAGKVVFQSANLDIVVNGPDKSYAKLTSFKRLSGVSSEVGSPGQVIINEALMSTFGVKDPQKMLDKQMVVKIPKLETSDGTSEIEQIVKVVAVVRTGSGAEVFISPQVYEKARARSYSQVKILANTQENVSAIRRSIESQGFTTTSPVDTLEQINQVFAILTILLAGFGAIGMIIAILGMINTLTISLLERTKEIGLLISLGARKKDVRRLFVIEALLLSLIGCVVGVVGAWLLGKGLNTAITSLAHSRGVDDVFSFFYIPFWLVLLVFVFTATIGFLVAFFPAKRASKISPIDALRHD
jgi:putative ABC transport system permease protein